MDADGRRFHLLLGDADWATVRPSAGKAPLFWDAAGQHVRLATVEFRQPATSGEAKLVPAQRRAATADRNGSIYAVTDDALGLVVTSSGSQRSSRFWPPEAEPVDTELFGPADPPPIPEPQPFLALAVTTDDFLVAVQRRADRGLALLAFDLLGGGSPLVLVLPNGVLPERPSDPGRDPGIALAAREGGGLWLLDRLACRIWLLDQDLGFDSGGAAATPPQPDDFQPAEGGPPRQTTAEGFAAGLDLTPFAPSPLAIFPWGASLLLLDRSGEVFELPAAGPPRLVVRSGLVAHDMIVARVTTTADPAATRILIVDEEGNQAWAFLPDAETMQVAPTSETFLLRRFGGRALVAVRGFARYDGAGGTWIPIVEKPQRRYETEASALVPPFDSGVSGTVWDCLVIDGCVPPGTRVTVFARAFDDDGPLPPFVEQPRPLLTRGRVDLPWHGADALPAADQPAGTGSHLLLLQGMRGRRLELSLALTGDGATTPRLRALRVWEPRVSWADRFLPGIYRSDGTGFLDRFLGNFQGEFRTIEERIAGAEHLFDPATAPAGTLAWLAEWFDTALDPSWDEARRRLFIANAEAFFRWRGTRRGLLMALRLAFDPCVDAGLFTATGEDPVGGIRIVESHTVRVLGAVAAGDPGSALPQRASGGLWTPAEGGAGLALRVAEALGRDPADQPGGALPFYSGDPAETAALAGALGFTPSGVAERLRWRRFQSSEGRGPGELADLPRSSGEDALWPAFLVEPSAERALWQQFLEGRYRRTGRLRAAHGAEWARFDEVSLPDRLPVTSAAQADWYLFETRVLPAATMAHRFSVLLPVASVTADADEMGRRLHLAQRIAALEKPAHTTFDVRFFWALNRVGEARLGLDTLLGQGSRAPELIPDAVLGRTYLGAAFIGPDGPRLPADRRRIAC